MTDQSSPQGDEANPLQGYYEWQITTLMLAYDLTDPIPQGDDGDMAEHRRKAIEQELGELVRNLLPQEYLENPERDFPPEVMMAITRATLRRAMEIAQL
ncbi:hypothetical protein ACERK3_05760 [Phycisphaerales bacterium AB-hyl4]|uniref:Uncharacterized protein n=1 Tax=Natronomicrosphaera hydrolytica TaxID=3242702 RepID=A0ABV4U4H8_9BACT